MKRITFAASRPTNTTYYTALPGPVRLRIIFWVGSVLLLTALAWPHIARAQAIITQSSLNMAVVAQAKQRIGRAVGDGSDVTLITTVLRAAGAQTGFQDYPAAGDHVWGVYLGKMTPEANGVLTTLESPAYDWRPGRGLLCQPGDVLEFTGVRVQSADRRIKYMLDNLAAVVTAVSPHGRYCRFVTQSVSNKLGASQITVFIPSLDKGTIRAFRPVSSRTSALTRSSRLNAKLLRFCVDKLGVQVNDGQCAMLVQVGLEKIGAATGFRDAPDRGDYVWGALVATITAHSGKITISVPASQASFASNLPKIFAPGNILQLHGVHIVARTSRALVGEDASHHTAVVEGFTSGTDVVHVLEQNSNGKLYVTRGSYELSGMVAGTIRVYQPLPQ